MINRITPESVGKMWMSRGSALCSGIYKKAQVYPLGMLSILCKWLGVNDCCESPHVSSRIQVKVNKYSLIECLVVIAMLSLLLTFMIQFFNKGTKICQQYSTRAHTNQQIMVLKNKWRKFIHKCNKDLLLTAKKGNQFISGEKTVEVCDDYINFTNSTTTERYKLSKNMNVNFKIENRNHQPLAIMNLEILSPLPKHRKNEVVRVVACPGIP